MNALGSTDVLTSITNNSAQLHQYHYTSTKLAILLTMSTSSRLNSYEANVTGSVRKAREAQLINKAKTLHPFGINRRDEAHL